MTLTHDELAFLSTWAREEWEPECYRLPAHHLQLSNKATGAELIGFIKAWTEIEGKRDQEILGLNTDRNIAWPWATTEEFRTRLAEVTQLRARHAGTRDGEARRSVLR